MRQRSARRSHGSPFRLRHRPRDRPSDRTAVRLRPTPSSRAVGQGRQNWFVRLRGRVELCCRRAAPLHEDFSARGKSCDEAKGPSPELRIRGAVAQQFDHLADTDSRSDAGGEHRCAKNVHDTVSAASGPGLNSFVTAALHPETAAQGDRTRWCERREARCGAGPIACRQCPKSSLEKCAGEGAVAHA